MSRAKAVVEALRGGSEAQAVCDSEQGRFLIYETVLVLRNKLAKVSGLTPVMAKLLLQMPDDSVVEVRLEPGGGNMLPVLAVQPA